LATDGQPEERWWTAGHLDVDTDRAPSLLFWKTASTVTVPHELSLKQFKLGGKENNSRIDSGILPFMVTPPGAMSKEASFRQDEEDDTMLDYGVVYKGATGLSLADSQAIRKSRAYIPLNWDEG